MNWPTQTQLSALSPLPTGYRYELLTESSISELVRAMTAWHQSFSVGAASAYLRESFYRENAYLGGSERKTIFVILIRKDSDLAGMFSAECDPDTLSLYARLAVVSPEHRGAGIMVPTSRLLEPMAKSMGLEFVYAMATLKIPHVQMTFERLGYRLLGFVPGYDREEVSPGNIKRVCEAVYGKVLVPPESLLQPDTANLTPTAKALFENVFPKGLGS